MQKLTPLKHPRKNIFSSVKARKQNGKTKPACSYSRNDQTQEMIANCEPCYEDKNGFKS